jgi:hypothetical protein
MNKFKFRAWFDDHEVTFTIGAALNHINIDQIAYEMLKDEGADLLLSEVEWEIV